MHQCLCRLHIHFKNFIYSFSFKRYYLVSILYPNPVYRYINLKNILEIYEKVNCCLFRRRYGSGENSISHIFMKKGETPLVLSTPYYTSNFQGPVWARGKFNHFSLNISVSATSIFVFVVETYECATISGYRTFRK